MINTLDYHEETISSPMTKKKILKENKNILYYG
jgi:hypothetical protein